MRALYVLPRGSLRSELLAALRQARKARRPRARGTARRGQIPNMTPLAARPAEVATRTVPGHWEGDLLKGARNGSAVGTLVERTTRLVILARMDGTERGVPDKASPRNSDMCRVPPLRKTLTYDRGKRNGKRAVGPAACDPDFFADPRTAPGNAAPMRIPMGCCASTCPKGQTCPAIPSES